MDTMFINSENSETSDSHRLGLQIKWISVRVIDILSFQIL